MRRVIPVLVLVLASFAALVMSRSAIAQSAIEVTGTRSSCVDVRAEARMQAYGFDHVVTIRNACAQAVSCTLSTSVNTSPTVLQLAPNESRDTLTWRGSPASVYTANVDCTTR